MSSWLRPVSGREHQEVSKSERQYEDGSDPRLLDIIDIPLLEHRPNDYQRENWLLDPERYWTKVGRIEWNDLDALSDPIEPLWENHDSSYNGINDRVMLERAQSLQDSLRLLKVASLQLSVFKPGEAFCNTKRRVQARFRYKSADYALWVTDPGFERDYLAKPDGTYDIGKSFMTVSLGEPYEGYRYKLVAAIMPRTPADAP